MPLPRHLPPLLLAVCGVVGGMAAQVPSVALEIAERNGSPASDRFAELFPSRVKTFVKASYDPDDRPASLNQGNDDGFSGQNLCESYRATDGGNPMAVIAHFEGRAGILGLFFRNFWSDSGGVPMLPGENNRTRMWIDGQLAHDMPLWNYFRNENDPLGQIPPFAGPFTGRRSGGHLTHAQLRWNQSFKIGLWDDQYHNAARFHRVHATIASPEGELPVPDAAGWEWIARQRGQWPHAALRRAQSQTLQLGATNGAAAITLPGPATLLELTCVVPQHADWGGLWARFTWDGQAQPAVDVPLRLLGAMTAPPHRFPLNSLLLANDGDRRISNWFPMPFASGARLEFINRGAAPVALQVTLATQAGVSNNAWGYFTTGYRAQTTGTGETFRGPRFTDCKGLMRFLMLEEGSDNTGRIANVTLTNLEGDLCVRINGSRGEDHSFDASETSIGRWGWYLTPADQPFVADSSFQSGMMLRNLPGGAIEGRRVMGSTFVFDPVHFVDGIDIVLEHGVQNSANADYGLLAFFYLQAGAARRRVAEIDIGATTSEQLNQVQFTQWTSYTRSGAFLRDHFYGSPSVTDSVRHIRDFLRFRVVRSGDVLAQRPYAIGLRLDRLAGANATICQADVFVDGQPAGLLHSFSHNAVYPWKEGGECEVELPRALTDGKQAFTVELRPRAGTDALRVARVWVYDYLR